MTKYKTVVVDYEGMQEALDQHSAQGWRLFCVNADTWRKLDSGGLGDSSPGPLGVSGEPPAAGVYSASYYLLVFMREEDPSRATMEFAEEIEEIPHPRRTIY